MKITVVLATGFHIIPVSAQNMQALYDHGKNVQLFLHAVPKTGVVTELLKRDTFLTRQNLNNYEPKLRISFKITWLISDIFQTAGKRSEKKVERLHSGTF